MGAGGQVQAGGQGVARDDGCLLSQYGLAESAPRCVRPPLPIQDSAWNTHLGTGIRAHDFRGRAGELMSLDRVEKIAEAVLYEGYLLYPYRASAVKNQQRWNFGVLCPLAYSEAQQGSDAWSMQTECLLQADPLTLLNVKIR